MRAQTIITFPLAALLGIAAAFQSPSVPSIHRTRLFTSSSNAEQELTDMEELIISLSLEPTDESRRERLAGLFQEVLTKPNGDPKRFSDLFDRTLIEVGDRVRKEALEKLEQKQNNEGVEGKTAEELQVWALVDMMVQSKTMVKRANGELGNGGTFA